MRLIVGKAAVLLVLISLTACKSPVELADSRLAYDQDFNSLVTLVTNRLSTQHTAATDSDVTWEALISELLADPAIKALSASLHHRYPELSVDSATDELRTFLADSGISETGIDISIAGLGENGHFRMASMSDADYYLCLGSVASMGVIMMAGCSTLGPIAVACGAAVASWVAFESAQCHVGG